MNQPIFPLLLSVLAYLASASFQSAAAEQMNCDGATSHVFLYRSPDFNQFLKDHEADINRLIEEGVLASGRYTGVGSYTQDDVTAARLLAGRTRGEDGPEFHLLISDGMMEQNRYVVFSSDPEFFTDKKGQKVGALALSDVRQVKQLGIEIELSDGRVLSFEKGASRVSPRLRRSENFEALSVTFMIQSTTDDFLRAFLEENQAQIIYALHHDLIDVDDLKSSNLTRIRLKSDPKKEATLLRDGGYFSKEIKSPVLFFKDSDETAPVVLWEASDIPHGHEWRSLQGRDLVFRFPEDGRPFVQYRLRRKSIGFLSSTARSEDFERSYVARDVLLRMATDRFTSTLDAIVGLGKVKRSSIDRLRPEDLLIVSDDDGNPFVLLRIMEEGKVVDSILLWAKVEGKYVHPLNPFPEDPSETSFGGKSIMHHSFGKPSSTIRLWSTKDHPAPMLVRLQKPFQTGDVNGIEWLERDKVVAADFKTVGNRLHEDFFFSFFAQELEEVLDGEEIVLGRDGIEPLDAFDSGQFEFASLKMGDRVYDIILYKTNPLFDTPQSQGIALNWIFFSPEEIRIPGRRHRVKSGLLEMLRTDAGDFTLEAGFQEFTLKGDAPIHLSR